MERQISMEDEAFRLYSQGSGNLLKEVRRKKNIKRKDLCSGVINPKVLKDMEEEKIGWSKMIGNFLLQHMGVGNDYFEEIVTGEELDRWRLREDICYLIWEQPSEARKKLKEFYSYNSDLINLEKQFLYKMEAILLLGNTKQQFHHDADTILKLADLALRCTVQQEWKNGLEKCLFAPAELEAILLLAISYYFKGEDELAWRWQQEVWYYPRQHKWEEQAEILILPQAAIIGIELCKKKQDYIQAFLMGKTALDKLRCNFSHRYVLTLLKQLSELPLEQTRFGEEQAQIREFRDGFIQMYQMFSYPQQRIWQSIAANNVYEMGAMLKMLRISGKKSIQKALKALGEYVISNRQLEKIESGQHKPSYRNYKKLIQPYNKSLAWGIPLLDTDSVEVLQLRKDISVLLFCQVWDEAEINLRELKFLLDNSIMP